MRYTFTLNMRFRLMLALFALAIAPWALRAQGGILPVCNGPLTVYFNIYYFQGCEGLLANVKVVPNAGTPPFQYQWSNGDIDQIAENLGPGDYSVTVTDSTGYAVVDTVTIYPPAQTPLSATASVALPTCNNARGAITVTSTGGTPPYDYRWWRNGTLVPTFQYDTSAIFTIKNLLPGTYNIIVADERNCRDTLQIVLGPVVPVTVVVNNPSACLGGTIGSAVISAGQMVDTFAVSWTGPVSGNLTNQILPLTLNNLPAGNYTVTLTADPGCTGTASFSIVAATGLQASISGGFLPCSSTATLSVQVNGGTPGYSYNWSIPGADTSFVVIQSPGIYSVTVIDAAGCQVADTTTAVLSGLFVSVKATALTCFNSQNGIAEAIVVSGGVPPFSYQWSNGSQTQIITGLAAGSYTVTVTDSQGCSGTSTAIITQPSAIEVDAAVVGPICGGQADSVVLSATGGTAPYTFLWNGQILSGNTILNVSPGVYSFMAVDANNCIDSSTVTIAAPLGVTVNLSGLSCEGFYQLANLDASGGTLPYSFSWNGNPVTGPITQLGPGTYTVIVTDANACTASNTITVVIPSLDIAINAISPNCFGETTGSININFNPIFSPVSYTWSTGISNTPLTGIGAGTYFVTITFQNNPNCTQIDTIEIAQPDSLVVNIQGQQMLCMGDSTVSLQALASGGVPPYQFVWSNGLTGQTLNDVLPGTYGVTVTDANGCTASVIKMVDANPVDISLELTTSLPSCEGFFPTVTLNATGGSAPYTFTWNGVATSNPIAQVPSGTYIFGVIDGNGCTETDTLVLTVPSLVTDTNYVIVPPTCFGTLNGSITPAITSSYNPVSYVWLGTNIANAPLTGIGAGTYVISVTIQNNPNCSFTDTIVLAQPDQLAVDIVSLDPLNCTTDSLVSLQAVVTGGTAPYQYLWNTNFVGNILGNVPSGQYSVTVTDANGCTASATETVNPLINNLSIKATLSSPSCEGFIPTVVLSATGGLSPYVFAWNGSTSSDTLQMVTPGTYSAVVTDANGCTASTTVQVVVPPAFNSVTFGVTLPACYGLANGSITPIISSAYTPVTYTWLGTAVSNKPLTGIGAGTYIFQAMVQDNPNCMLLDTIVLANPDSLMVDIQVAPGSICLGNSLVSLQAVATGGTPPYQYLWNFGGVQGPFLNNVPAGTYTVTVMDKNGCRATVTEQVDGSGPSLELQATVSTPSCEGFVPTVVLTPSGGTAPYSFTWNGNPSSDTITMVAPGTYVAVVTDANGCTASDTVNIVIPPFNQVTYGVTLPSCFGFTNGSITPIFSTVYTPVTYSWVGTNIGNQPLTGIGAGTYILQAMVQNNPNCMLVDTIVLTQPDTLTAAILVTSGSVCSGDSLVSLQAVASGGTAPYQYLWNNSAQVAVLNNVPAGNYSVTITDNNGCTATATVNAGGSGNALELQTTVSTPSCEGFVPTVVLTPSGGTAPYSFTWNGNPSSDTITLVTPGTYVAVVTDANGCTASDTVNIVIPPFNQVTYGVTLPSCFGFTNGSITPIFSTVFTPVTYSWVGTNISNQPLTGIGAGTYILQAMVQNNPNCMLVDTIVLTQPDTLTAAILVTSGSVCSGDSLVSLQAVASGGTAPYQYLWNNSAQVAVLNNVPAGNYSVTITDNNGCTATATVNAGGSGNALELQATVSTPSCEGFVPTVVLTPSGGTAPYSFTWNGNPSSDTITLVTPGTYVAVVTDANGCTASDTVNIVIPPYNQVTYGVTLPSCFGFTNGSIIPIFSTVYTPVTYSWVGTNISNQPLTGIGAGTYILQAMVQNNPNCMLVDTIVLTQPDTLTAAILVTSGSVCSGDSLVSLQAVASGGTAPYQYLWNNSAQVAVLNNVPAGNYSVTITDNNGCTATATVNAGGSGNALELQATVSTPSCEGFVPTVVLTPSGGTAPYSFTWNGNPSSDTITLVTPGTYVAVVTDANGCTASDTVNIMIPPFNQVTYGVTLPSCFGFTNGSITPIFSTVFTPVTYSWVGTNIANQPLTGIGAGTYVLTAVFQNNPNCVLSDTITLSQPTLLSVTISDPFGSVCQADTVISLQANPAGGTPSYTYIWSGTSQTGQIITNAVLGNTYTVTVTDTNGCTASATAVVNTLPAALQLTVTPSDNPTCEGIYSEVLLSAVNGTPPYNFYWDGILSGASIENVPAGGHTAIVTDAFGCSDTVVVDLPLLPLLDSVDYDITNPACFGQNSGLISPTFYSQFTPITWVWSTTNQTGDLTGVGAGQYFVTITFENNPNCVVVDSVEIFQPTPLEVVFQITDSLCLDNLALTIQAVISGGTDPYTILWSNGSTSTIIENVPAGPYCVTITDAGGCTAVACDTFELNKALEVEVIQLVPACVSGAGLIEVGASGGNGPYTFIWNDNAQGPIRNGVIPGSYSVTVTDVNNCQADTTIVLPSIDSLDVSIQVTPAPCPLDSLGIATALVSPASGVGTFTYSWSPGGFTGNPLTGLLPGTEVMVTVTDVAGCTGTASAIINSLSTLQVSINVDNDSCGAVGPAIVTAVITPGIPPYQIDWILPDTTLLSDTSAVLSVTQPGMYLVIVTDSTGCVDTAIGMVAPMVMPMASFDLSSDCQTGQGWVISVENTSTDAMFYDWTITSNNHPTLQYNSAQIPPLVFVENDTVNITLVVGSKNGCLDTAAQVVFINSLPEFQVSAGDTTVACSDTIPIPIAVTGDTSYTYTWTPVSGLTFVQGSGSVFALPDSTTLYVLSVSNGICVLNDSVLVVVPDPLNLEVDPEVSICDGDSIVLTATTDSIVNFIWTDLTTGQVITHLNDSTSSITVYTDSVRLFTVQAVGGFYGCVEMDTIVVSHDSFSIQLLKVPSNGCAFDTIALSVITNAEDPVYKWASIPAGLTFINGNTAMPSVVGPSGVYVIQVEVLNGACIDVASDTITFDTVQTISGKIKPNTCFGLEISFTNPDSLSGTWIFGDNTSSSGYDPVHVYSDSGLYKVTFMPEGAVCAGIYSDEIKVLKEQAVNVQIGATFQECFLKAEIEFKDQSTLKNLLATREWNFQPLGITEFGPVVNLTINEEDTVMAYLTIVDNLGCSGMDSLEVPVHIVTDNFPDSLLYCLTGPVALNPDANSSYQYLWSATPSDLTLDPNIGNPVVNPGQTTTYYVLVTNGSCILRDTVDLMAYPAAALDVTGDTVVCSSAQVLLDAQGTDAVQYQWSADPQFSTILGNTDSFTATAQPNAVYYVRAFNDAQCMVMDSVRVSNDSIFILPSGLMKVCVGESATLQVDYNTSGGPVIFQWTPALPPIPNPQVFPNDTINTYSVIVSNASGCSSTASYAVQSISVTVDATIDGPTTVCTGETTTLVANPGGNGSQFEYSWTPAETLDSPNEATTVARPNAATVYTVQVIADGLCSAYDTVIVNYRELSCSFPYVFVPKAFTPNGDSNNDVLYVRGALITEMQFVVWDRWGEKVFETNDKNIGWNGTYRGEICTPDSYAWHLRATCGDGIWVEMQGDVTILK